ncbi:hypothetical protein BGY98DRAFT_1101257 [Russula aff. rugulosa BPL654]|nr:hypothetical protein BGY98DRAFT_1101257 [Russula aff. rugulosa BPL654]
MSNSLFNNALKAYEKRTKKDLLAHPLAADLQNCNSPTNILAILHKQVQGLDQSMSSDDRWTKWLDPTVHVLYMLSETLGKGISLVFSPGKAAKNTRKSHETLIEIFGRIESFFRRLSIYTQVPSTPEMLDTIIQIMVEVLTILGIATKEMKQGRLIWKRLIGKNDMEDALKNLDMLTLEEARMTIAENLRATHAVDDKVAEVICDGRETMQVVKRVERSSSPNLVDLAIEPYPSFQNTNCGIASTNGSPHRIRQQTITSRVVLITRKPQRGFSKGTFTRNGNQKVPSCGFTESPAREDSTVIEDIKAPCDAGQASMAYFYFDFRNASKQYLRNILPSLLTQLSARSSPRCGILSELYSAHDDGKNQPSDSVLTKCLQDMLSLPDQRPIYLIMDALDESSITSGIPSARERVLQLLKELVDLGLPNLHICVTSRSEIDIRNALEPLTSLRVSLHDQTGQREDIADYVRSIVYSNSDTNMRRWKKDDKDIVVKTLSERADGMFRWTFCQLEVLRDCLPSSVRDFLEELPESLDETYERVLREIKKPNRDHADVYCNALLWQSDHSASRSLQMSSPSTSMMRRASQS